MLIITEAYVIGLLKEKSAADMMSLRTKNGRMVRERTLWAQGCCVSTVGIDEEIVQKYIKKIRNWTNSKRNQAVTHEAKFRKLV